MNEVHRVKNATMITSVQVVKLARNNFVKNISTKHLNGRMSNVKVIDTNATPVTTTTNGNQS